MSRRRGVSALALSVGSCALAVVVAFAAAGQMSVSNLGQPGLESDPPQATLQLQSRGSCADVLTARQIDDGSSPCPPGTWPPTGEGAWHPQLDFAAGDVVQLVLPSPATKVRYSSTSDDKPGGSTAPDGQHADNAQWLGPSDAEATSEATRWLVRIPNPVAPAMRSGATFSVAALTADGWQDFAFSLRSPRLQSYDGDNCGVAWYAPGEQAIDGCASPPGGPQGTPTPSATAGFTPTPSATATPAERPTPGRLLQRRIVVRSRRIRIGVTGANQAVHVALRFGGAPVGRATTRDDVATVQLRRALLRKLQKRSMLRVRVLLAAGDATNRASLRLVAGSPG